MSQLIEALKKAEEAKRKEAKTDAESASEEFSLELEPTEPADVETVTDASYLEMEKPDFEDSLELEPTLPNSPDPSEDIQKEVQPAGTGPTDDLQVADPEFLKGSSSDPEPLRRRLTDGQETAIEEQPVGVHSSRKRLYLLFLVAFLLIAGFVSYYFLIAASGNGQYAVTTSTDQNRGFLGSDETRSSRDALINQTLTQDAVTEEVDVLLGPAELSSEEFANRENEAVQDSKTISAVNALVATSRETTSEPAIIADSEPSVFIISQSNQVTATSKPLALNASNSNATREELLTLLTMQPNNISALSRMAQMESGAGNYHQAAEMYSRILELDPRNASATAGLTRAVRFDDPLHYEASLRGLALEHPQAAFIQFMLGNHLSTEQRWSEAKGAYLDAIERSGSTIPADYHFNLAVSLERLHQPGAALQRYKQAALAARQESANFDEELLAARIAKLEGLVAP